MDDDRLLREEKRRAEQHGALKADVERTVDAQVAARAQQGLESTEQERLDAVAGTIRREAIDEVVQSEREVRGLRAAARAAQVVDYAFFVVYALLGLRFALGLMAARESAGFVRFVRAVTEPLYLPFKGIVAAPAADNGMVLALPLLVAIAVYALLHLAIKGALRLVAKRRTDL